MTREYLGISPIEASVWSKTGRTPVLLDSSIGFANNYMELVHNTNFAFHLDADDGDSNPGSRGAIEGSMGAPLVSVQLRDGFITPGAWKRYVTYSYMTRLHSIGGSGYTEFGFIASHHQGVVSVNGNVRIIVGVSVPAGTVVLQAQYRAGGSWTNIGIPSITISSSYAWISLQVDRVGPSGNPGVRILRNGVSVTGWAYSASIIPAVHSPTPSPGYDLLKGAGSLICSLSACVVFHDDAVTLDPTSSDDVLCYYPDADGSVSTWPVTGNESCHSSDKWAAMDDPEDDEPSTDNYTQDPGVGGGGDKDQLFTVPTLGAATVKHVAIGMIGAFGGTTPDPNYDAIIKEGGTTLAKGLYYGKSAYLAQFPLQADGSTAWADEGDINDHEFGIRAKNGRGITNAKAYGLYAAVYGTGLSRQSKAAACPVAGGQRRRGVLI